MNPWTAESRSKLSASLRGRTIPSEVRSKMSANHARHMLGKKMSVEARQKMSASMKGRVPWNKGMSGQYTLPGSGNKTRARMILRTGQKNPMWKGGITPIRTRIWRSDQYQTWRKRIFLESEYACQMCGVTNGSGASVWLEADHYPVPFAVILERIMKEHGVEALFDAALGDLELWNAGGRALCRKCHNTTKKGRFTKAGYLRAKAEELQLARHQQ